MEELDLAKWQRLLWSGKDYFWKWVGSRFIACIFLSIWAVLEFPLLYYCYSPLIWEKDSLRYGMICSVVRINFSASTDYLLSIGHSHLRCPPPPNRSPRFQKLHLMRYSQFSTALLCFWVKTWWDELLEQLGTLTFCWRLSQIEIGARNLVSYNVKCSVSMRNACKVNLPISTVLRSRAN